MPRRPAATRSGGRDPRRICRTGGSRTRPAVFWGTRGPTTMKVIRPNGRHAGSASRSRSLRTTQPSRVWPSWLLRRRLSLGPRPASRVLAVLDRPLPTAGRKPSQRAACYKPVGTARPGTISQNQNGRVTGEAAVEAAAHLATRARLRQEDITSAWSSSPRMDRNRFEGGVGEGD